MLRLSVILGLALSLFFLIRSGLVNLSHNPLPPEKKIVGAEVTPSQENASTLFFHQVPMPLPDLHKGYVFNADRELIVEVEEPEPEDKEEKIDKEDLDIDFESVSYVGSIITKEKRKAIISYSVQPKRRSASRRTRRGSRRAQKIATKAKYAQLIIGDEFNDFKVTEILTDKIVFERDDEKIEKLLHDPKKNRLAAPTAPATPAAAAAKTKRGQQAASSRITTVGRSRQEAAEPKIPPHLEKAVKTPTITRSTRRQPPQVISRRRPPVSLPPGQPQPTGSTRGE